MASQATITAKIGPGFTETAKVFADVRKFTFDLPKALLTLEQGENRIITYHDISTAATFTLTLAAGSYTLTVA